MSGLESDSAQVSVRPGHLRLTSATDVRSGLVGAMAEILRYATESAAGVHEDRVRALHEYRKSARRARALLALCRAQLDKKGFGELWTILRTATKPTSKLRDRDVFPSVLDRVVLPSRFAEAAQQVKTELLDKETPVERVAKILARGSDALEVVPDRFAAALPDELDWLAVEKGLRRSYRTVRKELGRVRRTGKIADFHSWRKRTKELVYQIELLTEGLEGEAYAVRQVLSQFATELGEITDRTNLSERLKKGDKSSRRLAREVRKDGKRKMKRAIKMGTVFFRNKPKVFARELMSAFERGKSNGTAPTESAPPPS